MNIVLIGLRGTGKTTVGRLLAQHLRREFFDTDEIVEKISEKKPRDIIEHKGWPAFRAEEKEAVKWLRDKNNAVIATGGGIPLDPENVAILKKNGYSVLFRAPFDLIVIRTMGDDSRPPLTEYKDPYEEAAAVWNQRKERYLACADTVFEIEDVSAEENAEALYKLIIEKAPHALA